MAWACDKRTRNNRITKKSVAVKWSKIKMTNQEMDELMDCIEEELGRADEIDSHRVTLQKTENALGSW